MERSINPITRKRERPTHGCLEWRRIRSGNETLRIEESVSHVNLEGFWSVVGDHWRPMSSYKCRADSDLKPTSASERRSDSESNERAHVGLRLKKKEKENDACRRPKEDGGEREQGGRGWLIEGGVGPSYDCLPLPSLLVFNISRPRLPIRNVDR